MLAAVLELVVDLELAAVLELAQLAWSEYLELNILEQYLYIQGQGSWYSVAQLASLEPIRWRYFDQEYSLRLAADQQREDELGLVGDLALVVVTATD